MYVQNFSIKWLRDLKIWKYLMACFSVELVKTADLSADRHNLMCIFLSSVLRYVLNGDSTTILRRKVWLN